MADIGDWDWVPTYRSTIRSGEDPSNPAGYNDNLLIIKTAVNSKLDKSGTVTSFPTVGADMTAGPRGTATSGTTEYNSYDLILQGSIWDGAQARYRQMKLRTIDTPSLARMGILYRAEGGAETEVLGVNSSGHLVDANGNEWIAQSATGSAVNHVQVTNAAAGNDPAISAVGDDTDIGLNLVPKGTGKVQVNAKNIDLAGAFTTAGAYALTLTTTGATNVTLPTAGTLLASPLTALGDVIYGGAAGATTRLAGNTTTTRNFLRQVGDGVNSAAPAWDTVTKTDVGLSNVENTALSTWAGTASITTVGTIGTGTWQGTAIGIGYGGTGQATATAAFDALSPMTTLGDTIYGGAAGTRTRLAGNTTTTRNFLLQVGDGVNSAAPAWDAVTATDVGLSAVENTALSTWAGTTNITTLGTIATGTWNATAIGITKGGTGQATAVAAFDALSPVTTLGDIIYRDGSNNVRLAGNTTTTRKWLRQTGDGANSAAPAWDTIAAGDVDSIAINMGDQLLTRPVIKDYGETLVTVAASGATYTIDLENGNVFDITMDQDCTFTFSNPPASGTAGSFTLYLRQDGTGGWTATLPGSVVNSGGSAPTPSTGVSEWDKLVYQTIDGGTTWEQNLVGSNYS